MPNPYDIRSAEVRTPSLRGVIFYRVPLDQPVALPPVRTEGDLALFALAINNGASPDAFEVVLEAAPAWAHDADMVHALPAKGATLVEGSTVSAAGETDAAALADAGILRNLDARGAGWLRARVSDASATAGATADIFIAAYDGAGRAP